MEQPRLLLRKGLAGIARCLVVLALCAPVLQTPIIVVSSGLEAPLRCVLDSGTESGTTMRHRIS